MNKVLVFFIFCSFGLAQKADLTSAILAFQKNDYVSAKEFIDIAYDKFMQKGMDQEKPKLISKFWHNRGRIYYALDDLEIAVESFSNDLELNAKGGQQKKSLLFIQECAAKYNNLAIEAYNNKDYLQSAQYFEDTYNIKLNPSIGLIDTLALHYAAFLYYNIEDFTKSLSLSNELVSLDSKNEEYQIKLIDNLRQIGSDEELLSAINFARSENPSSIAIVNEEVNYYINKEDYENLKISLHEAIKADPLNHILYFNLGNTYDILGESVLAEEYYLKALDIKPDHFDSNNNLAAMFVNQSNPVSEELSKTYSSEVSKRKKLIKEYTDLLNKALIYLEKCLEIEPESMMVLRNMSDVYAGLNNLDTSYEPKLLEVLAKIRELNQ